MRHLWICLLTVLFLSSTSSFSIPGVSTGLYHHGQKVQLYAKELDSIQTQLPFEYYFLNFCPPDHREYTHDNLGSILLGESNQNTPYEILMEDTQYCKVLCSRNMTKYEINNFKWMIERKYKVNWMVDNLPALHNFTNDNENYELEVGFPLGYTDENDNKKYFIYNHVKLVLHTYTQIGANYSRIVGFNVEPHSVNLQTQEQIEQQLCENREGGFFPNTISPQELTEGNIVFTYDVVFKDSNKIFGSRWDNYKFLGDEKVHWLSILNSFVINIILTAIIAHILRRTLRNDIRLYNELRTTEEVQEDTGWKQLSRDVFRPPEKAMYLAVFVGTGIQLGCMSILTLVFAALGFMEQSLRGNLLTTIILLFNFMGIFAGYYSARIYKMFNGTNWIRCTLQTAILFPGINFLIFYLINIMLVFEQSSGAVNTGTILILCAFWFGISTPLVFLGSLIGYKKQTVQNPCKYNPIPRFIPPQPWYLNKYISCLLGGLLPFGAVFMELVFIMMSIWRHSFYYLFAFLFLVIIILLLTCAEISIVISYLQLCHGNHRLWWRSFMTTGSAAIYIFAYSVFYYFTQLDMTRFSSTMLYFGYMTSICIAFFLICGSIGFLATFVFTRKIYSLIKID